MSLIHKKQQFELQNQNVSEIRGMVGFRASKFVKRSVRYLSLQFFSSASHLFHLWLHLCLVQSNQSPSPSSYLLSSLSPSFFFLFFPCSPLFLPDVAVVYVDLFVSVPTSSSMSISPVDLGGGNSTGKRREGEKPS